MKQLCFLLMLFLNSIRNTVRSFSTTSVAKRCDSALFKDILARIRRVNNIPPNLEILDFTVDGKVLGQVRPKMAELLCSNALVPDSEPSFCVERNGDLTLSAAAGTTVKSRTAAVEAVMDQLRQKSVVTGWRNELYPIASNFYDEPTFLMERAAVPVLGALEYGVHVNGLVQQSDGSEKMWIARRSPTKSKYPNMLDHIAAGGQPAGLGLMDNVIKECYEEAGIPKEMASAGNLKPAGAVSYRRYNPESDVVERIVLFNYDLYLPESFQPKPVDGEASEFFLMSMDDILDTMRLDYKDSVKPNCYLVIIDFLLRRGYLDPQVRGYLDILKELRGGDCK